MVKAPEVVPVKLILADVAAWASWALFKVTVVPLTVSDRDVRVQPPVIPVLDELLVGDWQLAKVKSPAHIKIKNCFMIPPRS